MILVVIGNANYTVGPRYVSPPKKEKFEGNFYCGNSGKLRKRNSSINSSRKRSKRIKSRRTRPGSQGMTAAIILIAFIITTAGIAFVILTMGSSYAQLTQTIGTQGNDYASSSLQVVGGFITGYDNDDDQKIEAVVFCMKLALDTGEVDLSATAIEVTTIITNNTEVSLTYNSTLDTYAELDAFTNNQYGFEFYNSQDSDMILDPNEMVQVFVTLGSEISQNKEFTIIIISGSAMIKVQRNAPTSISDGSNVI